MHSLIRFSRFAYPKPVVPEVETHGSFLKVTTLKREKAEIKVKIRIKVLCIFHFLFTFSIFGCN